MSKLSKPLDRKGSISLVVVFAMVAILGLGAIVIDGGALYFERAKLQTAVDAAVLAGARDFKGGALQVHQTALEVALANGVTSEQIQITVDQTNRRVWAHATSNVDLGLAKVLNFSQATVQATSEAGVFTLGAVKGVAPLGVVWQEFIYGQIYHLKVGDATTGNFGAMALGGTGAANYRDNMLHGFTDWLKVGALVPTETGNMSEPTRSSIHEIVGSCNHNPACTWDHHVPECPRVLIVPVIDGLPNGRGEVTILGFAGFFVEGNVGQGNDNYVRGRFLELFPNGQAGPAGDYGAYTVKLIR